MKPAARLTVKPPTRTSGIHRRETAPAHAASIAVKAPARAPSPRAATSCRLALALVALQCVAHGALAQPARASATNGKAVYLRVGCYTCHGTVGHGGAAPRLAPDTLPLEPFAAWVRNGSPRWSVASGMPAFPPAVISDAELADVQAFLASQPAPPAVADIPVLKQL